MNKDVQAFITDYGLTDLALALEKKTGARFSAQQINHWRRRGIPYKWQDAFTEISGLAKHKLRP